MKQGKVKNDDRADWTPAWQLSPATVAYVWHAGLRAAEVQASLEVSGFDVVSQIIWAKDRFALSRGDYHWKHEPCWYAIKSGSNHRWGGARDQHTLWEIPRADDDGHGHSTQKPIECMARAIRNHEGNVYEPFAGSGTTFVASENLHRTCFGLEIHPPYCAVILDRMSRAFPGIEIRKIT
jgi:DNA modification methylase